MPLPLRSPVALLAVLAATAIAAGCSPDGSTFCFSVPCENPSSENPGPRTPFPSVWIDVDFYFSDDFAGGARAARGGIATLSEQRSDVRSADVTTSTDGATLLHTNDGTYTLANGGAEVVDLDIRGLDVAGRSFESSATVRTEDVSNVTLAPAPDYVLEGSDEVAGYHVDSPPATIQLTSEAGRRLVDLSLELGAETSASVSQPNWDQLMLPSEPGLAHIALAADSFGLVTLEVPIVDSIDRLAATSLGVGAPVCFHAFSADLEVFATWTFESEDSFSQVAPNCVFAASGTTITASAFGQTTSIVIE